MSDLLSCLQFELPETQVARYPRAQRRSSQLLYLRPDGQFDSGAFCNLIKFLQPRDLLIFNDSKVLHARVFGHKPSGGKVEIFIERQLSATAAQVMLRARRPVQVGQTLHLPNQQTATVEALDANTGMATLTFHIDCALSEWLTQFGEVPIPPYFKREAQQIDKVRYQTVFASQTGSVAAPTAGLHFESSLLYALTCAGVNLCRLTLHVGAGTFAPLRSHDPSQHKMHSEWLSVSQALCDKIAATRQQGGRVIAVGTTVARALEHVALQYHGQLQPYHGETQLFIQPGFKFQVLDGLITNFHLPNTTLLLLVAAVAGVANTIRAYRTAIEQGFQFFSYGDAMLCFRARHAV